MLQLATFSKLLLGMPYACVQWNGCWSFFGQVARIMEACHFECGLMISKTINILNISDEIRPDYLTHISADLYNNRRMRIFNLTKHKTFMWALIIMRKMRTALI